MQGVNVGLPKLPEKHFQKNMDYDTMFFHSVFFFQITSLEGIGNKTYNNIRELYANDNKITSLKPLEGTPFFTQFQNISLRNNKIDQVSVILFFCAGLYFLGTYN